MLRIVMDSAGDFPPEDLKALQIDVIPVNVHFGERTFLDGVELGREAFYRMVQEQKRAPTTSQPSPYQFTEFYRRIARPGDTILSVHVTSGLSGTFASCQAAARELRNTYRIVPFDSGGGSAQMGFMCMEARLMERAGASLERILERLRQIRSQTQIILTLDTLEFARMSGRVRALQAALASVLRIKPVVELRDGILELSGRVRTRKRALAHVVGRVRERLGRLPLNLAVVHAMDMPAAQELLALVRNQLTTRRLIVVDLSVSVAANLGPGTVGLAAYPAGEV